MSIAMIASSYVSDKYGPEVLADNPLFYLELDELTGDFRDLSLNAYDFPAGPVGVRGAPNVRPESKGSLQGVGSQYLAMKNAIPAVMANGSAFTLEQWLYVPAGNVQGAWLGAGETNGWTVGFGSGTIDNVGRQIIILANYQGWAPIWNMPDGALTLHVVFTYNGGTWTLFINGSQVAQVGRSFAAAGPWLTIGALREGSIIRSLGSGIRLDSFAAYTGVLSNARILAHFDAAVGPSKAIPINFESGSLPSNWTPLNPVVFQTQPDAAIGTTKAMEFADIGDGGTTYVDFPVTSDGFRPFKARYLISSEGNYDFFRIYVNGAQQFAISGQPGVYQEASVFLPAGTSTVRLAYTKDGSASQGFDNVRISQVTW